MKKTLLVLGALVLSGCTEGEQIPGGSGSRPSGVIPTVEACSTEEAEPFVEGEYYVYLGGGKFKHQEIVNWEDLPEE